MAVTILKANLNDSEHAQAVIDLMEAYMSDPMGDARVFGEKENIALIDGLKRQPNALIFLAKQHSGYIGLCNSFVNFGTFAAKQFINIHDIIVTKEARGNGTGRLLIEAVIEEAKQLGCAKVTLEVRNDNKIAQKLYKELGFGECAPPMHFWTLAIQE